MKKSVNNFHEAIKTWDLRREPFFALAEHYDQTGDLERALIYYHAAYAIEFKPQGYLNDMGLYGAMIPDRIAFIYAKQGREELAREWWIKSLQFNPDKRILSNINWFYKDAQTISICVPVVRKEGFERLRKSIEQHNTYHKIELLPDFGEGSAIEKFNRTVNIAKGELVMFLADDTEIMPGCIENALVSFKERLHGKGVVVLNDGGWHDRMAHHFLASKNLRDDLGGNIFFEGYKHCGCDVELSERTKKMGVFVYSPNAKIKHYHHQLPTRGVVPNPDDKHYQYINSVREQDRLLLESRMKNGFKCKE